MATIIVETGAGLTNSNSYISEADFSTYATDRGVVISGTTNVLLVQAMDYIEQQPFQGSKNSDNQALVWPRYGVYVNDYYIDNDVIPELLKDALCEIALGIDGGNNPLSNIDRQVQREKVGPIDVTYMDGTYEQVYLQAAESKLSKLLIGGGNNAKIIRG